MLAGIHLFTTEPARHQIADAENRIAATAPRGDRDAGQLARAISGGSRFNLVAIDIAAAFAPGLAVLALKAGMARGM